MKYVNRFWFLVENSLIRFALTNDKLRGWTLTESLFAAEGWATRRRRTTYNWMFRWNLVVVRIDWWHCANAPHKTHRNTQQSLRRVQRWWWCVLCTGHPLADARFILYPTGTRTPPPHPAPSTNGTFIFCIRHIHNTAHTIYRHTIRYAHIAICYGAPPRTYATNGLCSSCGPDGSLFEGVRVWVWVFAYMPDAHSSVCLSLLLEISFMCAQHKMYAVRGKGWESGRRRRRRRGPHHHPTSKRIYIYNTHTLHTLHHIALTSTSTTQRCVLFLLLFACPFWQQWKWVPEDAKLSVVMDFLDEPRPNQTWNFDKLRKKKKRILENIVLEFALETHNSFPLPFIHDKYLRCVQFSIFLLLSFSFLLK